MLISNFVVACIIMAQCCEQGPRKFFGLKSCRWHQSLPHFHHPVHFSHPEQACEALDHQYDEASPGENLKLLSPRNKKVKANVIVKVKLKVM